MTDDTAFKTCRRLVENPMQIARMPTCPSRLSDQAFVLHNPQGLCPPSFNTF